MVNAVALKVESHNTVPENVTVAVIGSIRERNVVPVRAVVPFGGALRDTNVSPNRREFVTLMNIKAASISKTLELPGDK